MYESKKEMITYKDSGVDIEKAERFLKSIRRFIKNRKGVSAFGSLFELRGLLKRVKEPVLVSSCDGVGTKIKIAQKLGVHNTVGIDLVAMNLNDIICLGASPLFFLDYIAYSQLSLNTLRDLIKGIEKGLREGECLLLGGETAQMPGVYKKGEYDLAGFCVGLVEKEKIIDGRRIREGDEIVGLASSGLHSNGFSLVRKVFSEKEIKRRGEQLLRPTFIYVRPVLLLLSLYNHNSFTIKGIAHNTGGAFYSKLPKILPQGLGFRFYSNSWPVPEIFQIIQKKAKASDREMYSVFNMGIGMILVVKKSFSDKIITWFKEKRLKSWLIGEVIRSPRKVEFV